MDQSTKQISQLAIDTIRTLAMDGVQAANSGHPGTPMALAPVAYTLWNEFLRYDPAAPNWPARDRFVLSCGHASMLLYSMLHLAGVQEIDAEGNPLSCPAISLDNIRNFRQLHSPCAGHPEYGEACGIETTTGPLGQGIGNSVGMAIAAKWSAAHFNRPGHDLFDANVYAFCSDGDLMEGVGSEAASLAGHLKLSNLCWIYDDNHITIEGDTSLAFSEDVATRFEGLGWQVELVEDANDLPSLRRTLQAFEDNDESPTLIIVRSIIAYGSPNKANTHGAHGAPLGEDEVRLTKEAYGWPTDESFLVPDEVKAHFADGVGARGGRLRTEWDQRFEQYAREFPDLAQQWQLIQRRQLPENWDSELPIFNTDEKGAATRVVSGKVLNAIAAQVPWLLGGSADLAPSTMTLIDGESDFGPDNYVGRNLHFGIREHGMAAACNGMALAGLRPYAATFFVFTDYMRASMRLSAMMRQPVIYVLTHDSIGLGEDGPTHQPVEHLAAMRAMPGMLVFRPGDANEVTEAYRTVLPRKDQPVAMVLTRQALPTLDRNQFAPAAGVSRGGYVLAEADGGSPDVILMGTGSELSIAAEAYQQLIADGVQARLVSLPCWEIFDQQDETYRNEVLPPDVTARVAVEAGVCQGWEKYLGPRGKFVGMDSFGASAPYKTLYEHFGITPEAVVAAAKDAMGAAS
ncbi:MAG: transketolase [Planctomycetota bacterium]|nr:transketolase [Planctomycetota bacterium]